MSRGPWKKKNTSELSNDAKQALKRAVIKAQLDKPKRKSRKQTTNVNDNKGSNIVNKASLHIVDDQNVKNAINVLKDDNNVSIQQVKRRRRKKAEIEAEKQDLQQKKVTIGNKVKKLPNGEELFKFAGYSVVKIDERNLMLKFKDLFLGYYSSNKLYDLLTNIGIRLLSTPTKVSNETNQAISDINQLVMSLEKFQKFLRSEFLCQNPL